MEPKTTNFYEPIILATIEKIVKPCNQEIDNDDGSNKNSPTKVSEFTVPRLANWQFH